MPVQVSQVTHNNNAHFYRIAIDIAKEGTEIWDLTPYFKGRVGDDNFGLQIVWYYQGRLLDVTNKTPYIKGNVGHYSFDDKKNLQMAADADVVTSHGKPSDCQANGQATYYFPQQMFPTDGIFKGFIGLEDENQNLTGVDIWFRVLPGVARMGHACDVYVDILDKTIADFKEKIRQQSIDFDAALQQELQKEKDLIQQKLDAASDSMDEDTAALKKLAAAVGAIQAQIDAGNIVTLVKHNQDFNTLKSGQVELDKRIADRLAQIDTTPTVLASGDAIKNAYPNGKDGVFIASDTWHKWVYIDGAWQDKGEYSTQALPLSKIPHNVKAYLDNSNAISWKKTTEPGSFAFTFGDDKLNINIIGDVRATIKAADVIAAASLSSDVNYQDSYFDGQDYMCVYHPSADNVEFVKTNTLLKPEDLILFGNHFLSWVGGLLVDDALGKEIRKDPIQDYTNEGTHVIVYFDDGKHLQVGKSNDPNFNVILPDAGINIKGSVRLSISKDDFWKQLRSYPTLFTLDDSGKLSGAGFMIAYDLKMQKIIAYDTSTYLYWYQIPLLIHHYGSVNGGLLWDDYIKSRALAVNTGSSDAGTSSVPKYWKQNLDAAIARVRRNMARAGSQGLTFLWITDQHWENNNRNSPALVASMMKNTQIPYMICGGDLINEGAKDDEIQAISDCIAQFKQPGFNFPVVFGNHDSNANWADRTANADKILSKDEIGALLINHGFAQDNQTMLNYPEDFSFKLTFDHTPLNSNWAVFAFDTGTGGTVSTEQLQELIDLAKEDKQIVVVAHWMLDNGKWSSASDDIDLLIDAINKKQPSVVTNNYGTFDLTGVKAHIVMTLAGHEHKDGLRYTTDGTPNIVTDSDNGVRSGNTDYPYIVGSTTEQCFDVFTIDLTNQKIYDVRVGRGIDREFAFV